MVNIAQRRKSPQIMFCHEPQAEVRKREARRTMKTSTEDQMKGSFHELKGTIKERVGKATNDTKMTVEGKVEKNAGKVLQQIGRAKESVVKLRGKLAEIKKAG
jgi:uncharacterized protein YjbJ (UPF0337 family)